MIRPYASGLASALRACDVLVVAGGLWASCRAHGMLWTEHHALAAAAGAALYLLFAEGKGLYNGSWRPDAPRREAADAAFAWCAALLGLVVLGYVSKTSAEFSRRVVLTWTLAGPVALVAVRAGARVLRGALRSNGRRRRAAIAGAGPLGQRVAEAMRSQPGLGLRLVGVYDDGRPAGAARTRAPGSDMCGSLDALEKLVGRGEVDVVFLALPVDERTRALARRLAGTPVSVYVVPDLLAFALLRSQWLPLGSVSAVSLFERPLVGFERVLKRAEDVAVATLCLAIAALPMALIAAAVKLSSPGPVLFRQRRHGLDGREIVVWKFRTMRVCEEDAQFRQARPGDPRVTRLGVLLRATSLDELPQLVNVVQGRMSIVGPRPHPLLLNEQHRDQIDWYMLRHRVKPGITGWAQVNGYRGETDTVEKMQRRVEHDLEYIDRWSLWLDVKIILLTLLRGFVSRNAC